MKEDIGWRTQPNKMMLGPQARQRDGGGQTLNPKQDFGWQTGKLGCEPIGGAI